MNTKSNKSQISRKFLLALLSDLANDKNYKKCFKAAHKVLHFFFWKLKENETSKDFVKDLLFDTNGNFPHSEQIDELLQEFQLSGIISRPNPTYKYNDISITSSPFAEELKKDLTPEQKDAYDRTLKEFKEELGVPAI